MLELDLIALTVCAGKCSHLELAVALKGFLKEGYNCYLARDSSSQIIYWLSS